MASGSRHQKMYFSCILTLLLRSGNFDRDGLVDKLHILDELICFPNGGCHRIIKKLLLVTIARIAKIEK